MKLKDIFRILKNNWHLILIFPLLMGFFVYFLTGKSEKVYTSDFLIYTGIGSTYKLTAEENPKLDNFQISNAFDNLMTTLMSRETIEEVSMRLLASHLMLETSGTTKLGEGNFAFLQEVFPAHIRKKVVVKDSIEATIAKLYEIKNSSENNIVSRLLLSGAGNYGIPSIKSRLMATRKETSDMLEIAYQSNDPAVSQQTLTILSEVFFRKYKVLKEGEIDSVVGYFDRKVKEDRARLKNAEAALRDFGLSHNIINYTEQGSNLSSGQNNLKESIEKERMDLAAANASLKILNDKLGGRIDLMENNQLLMQKRNELAEVNHKIADANLNKANKSRRKHLDDHAKDLKKEIEVIVQELYKINNTTEGLAGNDLLNQYLTNMLRADEATARLVVMEELAKSYEQDIADFAPLGAVLASLEREVEIAESEYLESLKAFNTNLQKQQNLAMANNLKLVDRPKFPVFADPDKRLVVVAGAIFAGGFLMITGVLAFYFLNNKLRSPSGAEKITGLEIAGVMPLMPYKKTRLDFQLMENTLSDQCAGTVILAAKDSELPVKISVTGTRPGEGKIRSAVKLATRLSSINGKVLLVYPDHDKSEVDTILSTCNAGLETLVVKDYTVSNELLDIADFNEISGIGIEDFKYIVMVIPSLSDGILPVKLMSKISIPLLVANAGRPWGDSDKHLLKLYEKACGRKPIMILNKVAAEDLEEIWGKLPMLKKPINPAIHKVKLLKEPGK
jgi:succinoglycan biosynthesis transport protein ExoP